MARPQHTPSTTHLEEALTVLFCLVDDAYASLNLHAGRYGSLKKLSDPEVLTLALFQQLRGLESQRSFLRDAKRFFAHLFPGVLGLAPSSFHRRLRKLRRFFEPLRRAVLPDLVGDPETLLIDSTLLPVLHPRQVEQSHEGWGRPSSSAAWVRWGTFSVYGVKLHLLCSANRVPLSYELTPANAADVRLTEELLDGANLGDGVARELLGDLAYRSGTLGEALAGCGVRLVTEKADQRGRRQQVEIAFAALKREFRLGETLAKTLVGLATRIAAKIAAYTPTASTSTGSWAGLRAASRSCGHEILATLI